jgi:hypothetical protein
MVVAAFARLMHLIISRRHGQHACIVSSSISWIRMPLKTCTNLETASSLPLIPCACSSCTKCYHAFNVCMCLMHWQWLFAHFIPSLAQFCAELTSRIYTPTCSYTVHAYISVLDNVYTYTIWSCGHYLSLVVCHICLVNIDQLHRVMHDSCLISPPLFMWHAVLRPQLTGTRRHMLLAQLLGHLSLRSMLR